MQQEADITQGSWRRKVCHPQQRGALYETRREQREERRAKDLLRLQRNSLWERSVCTWLFLLDILPAHPSPERGKGMASRHHPDAQRGRSLSMERREAHAARRAAAGSSHCQHVE